MENQRKTIVVRELGKIAQLEQPDQDRFPGKWIATILWTDDSAPIKYWMSDKQKRSLDRCEKAKMRYVAIDATDPAKERFVFASDNKKWLSDTFVPAESDLF